MLAGAFVSAVYAFLLGAVFGDPPVIAMVLLLALAVVPYVGYLGYLGYRAATALDRR